MMHGTMNVKKKAVHFEKKRKIGLKMKKSQADEDCMFLMSLLLSIKKKGRHSKIGTQNGISELRNHETSSF